MATNFYKQHTVPVLRKHQYLHPGISMLHSECCSKSLAFKFFFQPFPLHGGEAKMSKDLTSLAEKLRPVKQTVVLYEVP